MPEMTDAEKLEQIRQWVYGDCGFFAFTPTGTELCMNIANMMGWPLPWDMEWSVWADDGEDGERRLEAWLATPNG